MRKITFTAVCITATLILTSCASKLPEFTQDSVIEVTGRQGVCAEGDYYWVSGSKTLAKYDLETGEYKGKFLMEDPPLLIQGISYYNGYIYISCDDGEAGLDAPDHMYRTKIGWWEFLNMKDGIGSCKVERIKAFDDVIKQGEIEGLTFDKQTGDLLVLYNRGAIIVDGIKTGLYEGYDHEISEVFVYKVS